MAELVLKDVRKTYAGAVEAVKGVSLDIHDGALCVLVGPSGCGKSTLLRMIAGLETITAGTVTIGQRVVNELEPSDRDIAMVFQNYALYPHMSVRENMAYGLKNRGTPRPEIEARVQEASRILEIEPYLDRKPRQLSGGQRQRVAMGRAIVRKPQVFLFDEPLSNLDAKLRVQMRIEIKRLQRALGVTSVYVTHDQLEAMTLADILVVMNKGEVEQVGAPLDLYKNPASTFVAAFIGAPSMNLIHVKPTQDGLMLSTGDGLAGGAGMGITGETILGIRPEHFDIVTDGATPEGGITIPLTVDAIEPVGAECFVYASPKNGAELVVRVDGDKAPPVGAQIRAVAPRAALHLFDAGTGKRVG